MPLKKIFGHLAILHAVALRPGLIS